MQPHSQVACYIDGILTVHLDNSVWANQFRYLKLDLLSRKVEREGQVIDLQPREYKLLEFLLRRPNQVVTRTMLLEGVWEYHFDPQTNVIDVHISRLRSKIDKPFKGKQMLYTERGAGYALRYDE